MKATRVVKSGMQSRIVSGREPEIRAGMKAGIEEAEMETAMGAGIRSGCLLQSRKLRCDWLP